MKNLVLYLPHLEETLRGQQVRDLTARLSKRNIVVCEYQGTIPDHAVVLTDSAELAFLCFGREIPCCVLLDEAARNESLPNGAFCMEQIEDIDWEYLDRIERRSQGIPWEIAHTDRLLLREMTVADVPRLYELYRGEAVTRYMEPLYETAEQEMTYTQDYICNVYAYYGYGMWLIVLKETDEVIGRAGLEYKEGEDGLELGFMLGEDYWHRGYAYEACSAVLTYGREYLGCECFYARVHPDNGSSRRLCERLGMHTDGTCEEQGLLIYRKRGID